MLFLLIYLILINLSKIQYSVSKIFIIITKVASFRIKLSLDFETFLEIKTKPKLDQDKTLIFNFFQDQYKTQRLQMSLILLVQKKSFEYCFYNLTKFSIWIFQNPLITRFEKYYSETAQ